MPRPAPPSSTLAPVSRLVLGAVAAVAVATLAGPAPVAGPASAQGDPLRAVQAVLDVREDAVARGDRDRFLTTVDPRAPASFRAAQARSFDGLRSLPLASYSLNARVEDSGDLSVAARGRYGGARLFLPETRVTYRFEGYDDRDAVDELWLTFVERDGRWYVGGDTDLEALGLESDRQLWDLGPVRLERRERVMVLSHPEQAERAAALAGIAEDAVAAFAAVWDQPWSGRLMVVLPGSVDELERLLESTVDLDKFVAFAGYRVLPDEDFDASSPRVFIQESRLGRYGREQQVETLVHELVHVASAPLAGPFVPSWVHEGVADWAANGRPTGERRPSGGDGTLPRDFELSTGSQASIVRTYKESRAAMSLLAARKGAGAPTAFFRTLGETTVAPGSVDHQVDAALRRSAGLSLGELEAAWAARRP